MVVRTVVPEVYGALMTCGPEHFDYHGALVVVETDDDEIIFIHPPGGPPEAPGSLPSNPCNPGEAPQDAAVRMAREMTGLEVAICREFVTFIQEGTPTGTMCAHGFIARISGGSLIDDGPEGPARAHRLGSLPRIMPIRVANQRVVNEYLAQREEQSPTCQSSTHDEPV
jgi:ADP-ribose pyrophosphatase YjhB (NUDIX family)